MNDKVLGLKPTFFVQLFYIGFLASLVFAFRAYCSIFIALIALVSLIYVKDKKSLFKNDPSFLQFIIAITLVYGSKIIALPFSEDLQNGVKQLEKQASLILIPPALFLSGPLLNRKVFFHLKKIFIILLALAGMYCLTHAFIKFSKQSTFEVFFYHELVKPLSGHAIQASLIVFFGLVFLIETIGTNSTRLFNQKLTIILLSFLTLFLILLSSKLIIVFYFLFLFYHIYSRFLNRRKNKVKTYIFTTSFIILFIALFTFKNPVSNRFREIVTGDIAFVFKEKYQQGDYFNGLQFRLLQWRFVYELLNENSSWITGVTPAKAQKLLDEKYYKMDMYSGHAGTTDTGFIGYHTHNQFLQELLQTGIIGLFAFIYLCFCLMKLAMGKNKASLRITVLLLLVYCFTDAIMQTQYGLIIFTFFPVFMYLDSKIKEGVDSLQSNQESGSA